MLLDHVQVYRPETGWQPGWLELEGDRIARIAAQGEPRPAQATAGLDGGGGRLVPGFIELQINGGFGRDFTGEPESIWEVGARFPRYGVTAFLPTLITSPAEVYSRALAALRQGPPPGWHGAQPLGYHFEGPFLNPGKKGAHDPRAIHAPDGAFAAQWSRANGVWLVTLAPELPGALALGAELAARGVLVSAGHSLATLEDAQRAVAAGFCMATHLFNAMPPLDHRHPGLAAAALLDPRLTPGLIADGVHVHPQMVALAWRLKGPHGLALVTDAGTALGFPPGEYRQGGMPIVVDGQVARLPDGTLASSILGLDQALRNVMAFTGAALEEVVPALTSTPARLLGLPDYGVLRPGARADLVVLDSANQVSLTVVGGEPLYAREQG